ncbi:hypothetical protein GCM10010172_14310 [Paractinoplanes ferrugineus]|uniref:Uncharacterized protein n=1 Tax=Paractinoplanes ferrugineus TaxID=113564 RepID=A0A919J3N0_9ACTN|nr:hypothetical protein [Actinoplanes ferrugineus]GIE09996.1 hypothetical protein Afe05nite_18360 [Actinoplanes ferrugineus]
MLYGTPLHSEHRMTAHGGLALFVRGVDGTTGQHRPAPRTPNRRQRRRAPREPERTAQLLVRGLAALILLGLVVMTAFFALGGDRRPDAEAATGPRTDPLASRSVDTAPLTIEEVFPDRREVRPPAARPYRITTTHTDTDCRTATTGALGALLVAHGCSQVVRGGTTAPYDGYEVTTGLFNLADEAGANQVDDQLRHLVETGDGGFATLPATRGTLPTSQVGWNATGHYLLYCVITRTDGKLVTSDDPVGERITAELVDSYLVTMLARRSGNTA